MTCVYLLRCADDSLYCGWTTDVQRRLDARTTPVPRAAKLRLIAAS